MKLHAIGIDLGKIVFHLVGSKPALLVGAIDSKPSRV